MTFCYLCCKCTDFAELVLGNSVVFLFKAEIGVLARKLSVLGIYPALIFFPDVLVELLFDFFSLFRLNGK